MKKVIVGSKNPVKIEAARTAFELIFPEDTFECIGHGAPSGVSDQPIGDEETLQGAENRAAACKEAFPEADFWIGLEGGNEEVNGHHFAMAWMVTMHGDGIGRGNVGAFPLPPKVVELVQQGMELGHANDIVFKSKESKKGIGASGLLTNELITRSDYYTRGVIFSLIPFINGDLY